MHLTRDNRPIGLNLLSKSMIPLLNEAFRKPLSTCKTDFFGMKLEDQENGEGMCLISTVENEITGLISFRFRSDYPYFRTNHIPEMISWCVLPQFRKNGIGNALIEETENILFLDHKWVGICLSLNQDTEAAGLLEKRGYMPDSNGVHLDGKPGLKGSFTVTGREPLIFLLKSKPD